MFMMKKQYTVLALILLPVVVGCGKDEVPRNNVTGEVKLDGKPLERGSILFVPSDGTKGVVAGGSIDAGKYQLNSATGPVTGTNRVEIRAIKKTGRMVQKPMVPRGEMMEETAEAVLPRFNSNSTLKVQIQAGDNTCNFDVTSS